MTTTNSDLDREIRSTAVDFSFGELLNLHNDLEIIIRPEYQRLFRWSDEQRSRLIESILLGLPIPPIFLIENEDGVLELIDGLQRVSSVLQFLDHAAIEQPELILRGCDIIQSLNGLSYKTLAPALRLKLKRSPIRATIINKSGDPAVKYEMFKRLNTGGSLLSAQEIRNCSSRMIDGGEIFYEAIQAMASHAGFRTAISRLPESALEKRGDEELVLRFFAVTRYREHFRGNIEEWLNSLMEAILFRQLHFDLAHEQRHFEAVFELIAEKLCGDGFARFNDRGEAVGRLAPAYFEAVVAAFSEHRERLAASTPAKVKAELVKAFSSDAFKSATGPGANTIGKLRDRIAIVASQLLDNGDS